MQGSAGFPLCTSSKSRPIPMRRQSMCRTAEKQAYLEGRRGGGTTARAGAWSGCGSRRPGRGHTTWEMAGKGFERDREKAAYSGFPGGLWLSGSSDLESRLILFEQGSQLFVPAEPGHWAAGQRFRKIFFCQGMDGRQGIPHGVAALWCWFRNTSLMDQGCHCLAKAQQLLIVVGRLPFARAGSGDQTITDQRAEKDTCLLMCEKRHGRVYKAVAVVARASALPGQQVM